MVPFIDHVQLIVLIISMCTQKAVESHRPLLTLMGVNVFANEYIPWNKAYSSEMNGAHDLISQTK